MVGKSKQIKESLEKDEKTPFHKTSFYKKKGLYDTILCRP